MKMSDVFDLPEPCTGNIHDDYAAHAINNFDGLIEALDRLTLAWFDANEDERDESYRLALAALTAAKGETK
jgi:hypothetical protein